MDHNGRPKVEVPGVTPYASVQETSNRSLPLEDQGELLRDPVLNIIPRDKWCQTQPKWTDPLRHPVRYVFTTFTRKSHCFSSDQCFAELQYLHYKNTKFGDKPDIIYNFLIGGDGTVYEGRGWFSVSQLPKRYQVMEKQCISIAMMGTFQFRPPSPVMKRVQELLIRKGVESGYIRPKFTQFTT